MSPKLPAVTGRQVIRVAEQLGLILRYQVGSHAVYARASDGARVAIPVHAGHTIRRNTLRAIIGDLRVAPEEFAKLP